MPQAWSNDATVSLAIHRTPRPRGLARPLVLPRAPPDAARPPRGFPLEGPPIRDGRDSAVENCLGVGLDAVEGFSMKEVSVVLRQKPDDQLLSAQSVPCCPLDLQECGFAIEVAATVSAARSAH
jgi:hypothetical protein